MIIKKKKKKKIELKLEIVFVKHYASIHMLASKNNITRKTPSGK